MLSACKDKSSNIIKQEPLSYSFSINTENVSGLNLEDVASLDKIIPLETLDECLIVAIGKVFVTDSSLIVWDKGGANVFIFDSMGRFQRQIGNRGPSPQEYLSIGDIHVDKDTIHLLDVTARKIMYYHISGKFISANQSEYYPYSFYPMQDGCWGINAYQNKDRYNLILLDESLQKIKRGYFVCEETPYLRPTNNFSKDEKNNEWIFHYQDNDTIYKMLKDDIVPFVAIDFGENNKIENSKTEHYKGHIHRVHLYGDHLFFSFNHSFGLNKPFIEYTCYLSLKNPTPIIYTYNIIHDKRTVIAPLPEIINISKGKLIYQIVPGELPDELFAKELPYGKINGDSNPILVLYNLKE